MVFLCVQRDYLMTYIFFLNSHLGLSRLWRQILEIVPDSLAPNLKKVRVDLCGTTYKSMVKYEK